MINKLCFLLISSIAFQTSFAETSSAAFDKTAAAFSISCNETECDPPYAKIVIYDHLKNTSLRKKEILSKLSTIAIKQAQIWADTILEGDYVAEGNTRVDRVTLLSEKGKSVGYLVTYSEKAWNISDCLYDGLRPDSLAGCVSGRIVESSYVSLDFSRYFYDEKTAAVFK